MAKLTIAIIEKVDYSKLDNGSIFSLGVAIGTLPSDFNFEPYPNVCEIIERLSNAEE